MTHDEYVQQAREVAHAILKAWTKIHAEDDTALIAIMMDAVVEAILLEWPQWVEAVRQIGDSYITTSPGFEESVEENYLDANARLAQETWDTANNTFDQLFTRRWSGPILQHVLHHLTEKRHELKNALAREARTIAQKRLQAVQKPKRRKIRRKGRKKSKEP